MNARGLLGLRRLSPLLLALLMSVVILWLYQLILWNDQFPKIQPGDTVAKAIALMGHPSAVHHQGTPRGKILPVEAEDPYLEYGWLPVIPFPPVVYTISVDKAGRVVTKYEYQSP